MPAPIISEDEFIRRFKEVGASALAKELNCSPRSVFDRRASLEHRLGIKIDNKTAPYRFTPTQPSHRISLNIKNGIVFVGSDFHYWPGDPSVIHRAIVFFIKEMKPRFFIANGDILDACTISRHPPIGWEHRPALIDELETAQDRLHEIRSALPKGAKTIWPAGNHDLRIETRLATVAPEFARIHGVHLNDHFPEWESCWSVWINNDVVVKHRPKSGGIHSTHNNTLNSGKSIVCGHLHSAKVTPLTDYNGTRYGVDTGSVADIYGPMFTDYTEDAHRNWRSAFCILTFHEGRLLMPELVLAYDDKHVEFRGKVYRV